MRPTRLFLILVLSLVTVEYGGRALGVRAGLHHFAECPKGPAWDRSGERGQAGWDDHAAYMRVAAEGELVVPGGRPARPFGAPL
jgi:hypothetical protein